MTLDPVHFDGIAALIRSIGREVDESEHDDIAERIWADFLSPLRDRNGRPVVEPIDERFRGRASIDDVAVLEPEFPTVHGLDAGTLNPTTFRNGVVLDIAQAAMGCVPTDLDLHRSRSLVGTIHTGDASLRLQDEWIKYDDGYSRRRIFTAPRVARYADAVVHALALYRAEIEHAHWHGEHVDDLLVLDGSIYPTGLLRWEELHPSLATQLAEEVLPRRILEGYLDLIDGHLERDIPLVGFVKNPQSKLITRTLRSAADAVPPPWTDDTTMFIRLLRSSAGDVDSRSLTYTNWFRIHRTGEGPFSSAAFVESSDPRWEAEDYAVTFFIAYDPRDGIPYRIEAPYGFTKHEEFRDRIRKFVLSELAVQRGPPAAIAKADELARIGASEKKAIRRRIESVWETEHVPSYDEGRWGLGGR